MQFESANGQSQSAAAKVNHADFQRVFTLKQNQQTVEDLFYKVSSDARSSVDHCLDLEVDFCLIKNSMLFAIGPAYQTKLEQLSGFLAALQSSKSLLFLYVER